MGSRLHTESYGGGIADGDTLSTGFTLGSGAELTMDGGRIRVTAGNSGTAADPVFQFDETTKSGLHASSIGMLAAYGGSDKQRIGAEVAQLAQVSFEGNQRCDFIDRGDADGNCSTTYTEFSPSVSRTATLQDEVTQTLKIVINTGSAALTVQGATDNIDGGASDSIAAGEWACFIHESGEWRRMMGGTIG